MNDQNQRLIERIKAHIQKASGPNDEYDWHRQRPRLPAMAADIERAEEALGFYLPPLLKEIYQTLGDGGFGPGYGLFHLNPRYSSWKIIEDESSIVRHYQELRGVTVAENDEECTEDASITREHWPTGIIMLNDWVCNIYSCLDCLAEPDYPILRKDYNYSFDGFWLESPSLYQWLEAWADGIPLFERNWDAAPKSIVFAPDRLAQRSTENEER